MMNAETRSRKVMSQAKHFSSVRATMTIALLAKRWRILALKPAAARWALMTVLTVGISHGVTAGTNSFLIRFRTPRWTHTADMREAWGKLSLAELRAKAAQGEAEAQHYLGWRYSTGEGVETNQVEAAKWYRKSADQDFALAQNNLGALYEAGIGLPTNPVEAVHWYQKAASQGLPVAWKNLTRLAYSGETPLLKRQDYRHYLEEAALRGDLEAAAELGRSHLHPGVPGMRGNPKQAVRWLSYAAHHGYVGAYADLAWLYMSGDFIPQDYEEAQRWFEKGAEQGDVRCQYGMAILELTADHAAPDLSQVRIWLTKAADGGLVAAYHQLGRLSELRDIAHSPELKPNYAEAVKWYQKAADNGESQSAGRLAELATQGRLPKGDDVIATLQHASDLGNRDSRLELALRYWRGEGKPRSTEEEPEKLLRSLANGGMPKAMIQLADLYRTGEHFPKDPLAALHWLQTAASDPEAYGRLGQLKMAADAKQMPSGPNAGLGKAYAVYRRALGSAAHAAEVGRGYLDGSSPTNQVMAYAWLSLAAENGDRAARSEADQLLQKLSPAAQAEARQQATRLSFHSRQTWPGE